jgi:hypothetical protein
MTVSRSVKLEYPVHFAVRVEVKADNPQFWRSLRSHQEERISLQIWAIGYAVQTPVFRAASEQTHPVVYGKICARSIQDCPISICQSCWFLTLWDIASISPRLNSWRPCRAKSRIREVSLGFHVSRIWLHEVNPLVPAGLDPRSRRFR